MATTQRPNRINIDLQGYKQLWLDCCKAHAITAGASILKLMQQQADSLLANLSEQRPLVEEVRRRISRMLRDGAPSIEQVAEQMGYSARTLQRQLRDSGSSSRDETASVRCQIAQSYLRDPRLGLTEIALMLGYTEHSAFTRSFPAMDRHGAAGLPLGQPNGAAPERRRGMSSSLLQM